MLYLLLSLTSSACPTGRGVYTTVGDYNIRYCTFERLGSSTGSNGGGIYCSVSPNTITKLTIKNTIFVRCMSKASGGAVSNSQADVLVSMTCFIQCSSAIGGAIISSGTFGTAAVPRVGGFVLTVSTATQNIDTTAAISQDTFRLTGGKQYFVSLNSSDSSLNGDGSGFEVGGATIPSIMKYCLFAKHHSFAVLSLFQHYTEYDISDLVICHNIVRDRSTTISTHQSNAIISGNPVDRPYVIKNSLFFNNSGPIGRNEWANGDNGGNDLRINYIFKDCTFDKPPTELIYGYLVDKFDLVATKPNTENLNVIDPERCLDVNLGTRAVNEYVTLMKQKVNFNYIGMIFVLSLLLLS